MRNCTPICLAAQCRQKLAVCLFVSALYADCCRKEKGQSPRLGRPGWRISPVKRLLHFVLLFLVCAEPHIHCRGLAIAYRFTAAEMDVHG